MAPAQRYLGTGLKKGSRPRSGRHFCLVAGHRPSYPLSTPLSWGPFLSPEFKLWSGGLSKPRQTLPRVLWRPGILVIPSRSLLGSGSAQLGSPARVNSRGVSLLFDPLSHGSSQLSSSVKKRKTVSKSGTSRFSPRSRASAGLRDMLCSTLLVAIKLHFPSRRCTPHE